MLQKKFKKKNLSIQGSGKETRAFCYIEDAIDQIKVIEKNQKIMRFIMSDNQMNYQLEN